MKKRKYFQMIVSVVLCLALLMPCISVSAAGLGDLLTPSLSEDEVPATLDFEEMKAKGHVKRLYEEETELNQAIFENEDGTRTAYLFTEKIKYVDEDGKTKDKSQKLKSKFTVFENEENDLKVTYYRNLEKGIVLEYQSLTVEMFPQGIDKNVKSKVVQESKKNESDSVDYKKAFGNHTILRYIQTLNGIKEEIILEKETELRAFSFRILTHGAALVEEEGTARIFKGEESFELGKILMWDSAGNEAKGSYLIETVKENEEYLLTMDTGDFLDRSDLQYPVTVDPSVAPVPESEGVIEDITIYKNSTTTVSGVNGSLEAGNFDNYPEEDRGYDDETGDPIELGEAYALLKFPNLLTANGNFFNRFQANQIRSVELNVRILAYANANGTNSGNGGFLEAYLLSPNASWSEGGAVWNSNFDSNCIKLDRQYVPHYTSYNQSTWYSLNISYAVQKWYEYYKNNVTNGNNGIKLINTDLTDQPIQIYSRNHALANYRPYLSYVYEETTNPARFDDMVFRLKHMQSGYYATVEEGRADNGYSILLESRRADLTPSDDQYLDTRQLFRFNHIQDGKYCVNPINSGNGYYRRIDIIRNTATIVGGMSVSFASGKDRPAQLFFLDSVNASLSQFRFRVTEDVLGNVYLGTTSTNSGSSMVTVNDQIAAGYSTWILEPAYDYEQIQSYYSEMNFDFVLNPFDSHSYENLTITSTFGYRSYDNAVHLGIDLQAGDGHSIIAPFNGVVKAKATGDTDNRGFYIYIEATDPSHVTFMGGKPLRMVFMHMQSASPLSVNSTIIAGQTVLGYVGRTQGIPADQNTMQTHLHVGVLTNQGVTQNPTNMIDPLLFYASDNTKKTYEFSQVTWAFFDDDTTNDS